MGYKDIYARYKEQRETLSGYEQKLARQKRQLQRVDPRTPRSAWHQRQQQLKKIKQKQEAIQESKETLMAHEEKIRSYEKKGYKLKKTDEGYSFYQTVESKPSKPVTTTTKAIKTTLRIKYQKPSGEIGETVTTPGTSFEEFKRWRVQRQGWQILEVKPHTIYKTTTSGGGKPVYSEKHMDTIHVSPTQEKIDQLEKILTHLSHATTFKRKMKAEEIVQTKEWKRFMQSPQGKAQLQTVIKSESEKRTTQPVTWDIPIVGKVKQPDWMAKFNIATVTIEDPKEAELLLAEEHRKSKPDVYGQLSFRTRSLQSFGEASMSSLVFPITLPQTVVKLATGEGPGIINRIQTGKTILLPDVSKYLQEREIAPTQGMISGLIGEGITLGQSEYSETVKKYPMESGFATWGEILGLRIGAKAVSAGKSFAQSKWVGFRSKYIPIEKLTTKNVLSGKNIFPTSPSAKASLLRFKKTYDPATNTYSVTHAAPHRFTSKVIKAGESEFGHRGLFVTPETETSIYFLKMQQPYRMPYRFSILPKSSSPSILRFGVKDVLRVPKPFRRDYAQFGSYVKGRFGKAFITAKHETGGIEIEALIPEGTPLLKSISPNAGLISKLKGYEYHTKIFGRNVPIRDYTTMTGIPQKAVGKTWSKVLGYSKASGLYYSGIKYTSIINPSTIGYPISSLSKVSSKSSKKYSYKSSSGISSIISSFGYQQSYPKTPSTPSYSIPSYPPGPPKSSYYFYNKKTVRENIKPISIPKYSFSSSPRKSSTKTTIPGLPPYLRKRYMEEPRKKKKVKTDPWKQAYVYREFNVQPLHKYTTSITNIMKGWKL